MSSKSLALVSQFRACGIKIPRLQMSSIGSLSFAAAFAETPTTIMVNEAAAGMDFDPDTAVSKALVEYLERMAFLQGIADGNPICNRLHSDGIAAFPRSNPSASTLARENAYSEALERYVWARWWDDETIEHSAVDLFKSSFAADPRISMTLKKFNELLPIESITLAEPIFDNPDFSVIILFAKIQGHGYITGGAAGPVTKRRETLIRAMSELIRHGLGMSRFISTKAEPQSFYENRLLYFGLGHGNKIVLRRLQESSKKPLTLPLLEIDAELKSSKTDALIVTRRCLFVAQPPFVDGDLERLCL